MEEPNDEETIDNAEFYWVAPLPGITETTAELHDNKKKLLFKTDLIPAELKAAAWQRIEAAKLKQFYLEFSGAKDEQTALEIAKKYRVVGFDTEKFDAVKKRYWVD